MGLFEVEENQKAASVVRLGIAFGIIDTVAVLLRLLARWRSNAAFAADDWWIVWSLVPLYSMVAVGTMGMLLFNCPLDHQSHAETPHSGNYWWGGKKHGGSNTNGRFGVSESMCPEASSPC